MPPEERLPRGEVLSSSRQGRKEQPLAKIRRVVLIPIGVLLGIVALTGAGLVVWSKVGTYPAGDVAREAMLSDGAVEVVHDSLIRFLPRRHGGQWALVFYPGGLVDPAAYAPVLRRIAEQGIPTFITPMPLNLGILNTRAADRVIREYPDVTHWVLAGHSLGGATAAIYAAANSDAVDAVVFWDSYPPASSDLSESDLPVLSIYGTTNGVPNTDDFDAKRRLLPADAAYAPIEGASHAQFGDYGPQSGDVVPQITMEAQHQEVYSLMMEFLAGLR